MNILSQPFPHEQNLLRNIRNAFIGGAIVVIFLRVFGPFGFNEAPVKSLNLFAIGYGLVTVTVVLLFRAFETIIPDWFKEENWTVGKNILQYIFIIFFIGTANFYYTVITTGMPLNLIRFLNFQFFTLAITFVVASFLTMLKYFRSMNHFQKEAIIVENEVAKLKPISDQLTIIIKSENEKENLEMPLNNLYYIESADNYSKVVYLKNEKVSSILIRTSLKKLEDQFTQTELFRCHRSYIVQLRNVDKVTGNSQGYRLQFKNLPESIPVARRAGEEVHARLKKLDVQ